MQLVRNPYRDGAKVGVILPSVNTTTEPEFAWLAPPKTAFHFARLLMEDNSPQALRAMNAEIMTAAKSIGTIGPDLVAYACTAGTLIDGEEGAKQLAKSISSITNSPIVVTSLALLGALRKLGVARLSLGTPYPAPVTAAEKHFLERAGFEVVCCHGLERSPPEVRATSFDDLIDLALSIDRPNADAIFISCTDLRASELVQALEERLRKPVLTSNQVTLWAILRSLGRGNLPAETGILLSTCVAS
jgi:maleate cis-trans isomerase